MNTRLLIASLVSLAYLAYPTLADNCIFNLGSVGSCSQLPCRWNLTELWRNCSTNGFPSNGDQATISGGSLQVARGQTFKITYPSSLSGSLELSNIIVGDQETDASGITSYVQEITIANTDFTVLGDFSVVAYHGHLLLDLGDDNAFRGRMNVSGTGKLSWLSGSMDGADSLYIGDEAILEVRQSASKNLGVQVYNSGTMTISAETTTVALYGPSIIYNLPNGTIYISQTEFTQTNPGNMIVNNGTIIASGIGQTSLSLPYQGFASSNLTVDYRTEVILNSQFYSAGNITIRGRAGFLGNSNLGGFTQVQGVLYNSGMMTIAGSIDVSSTGSFVNQKDATMVFIGDALQVGSSDVTGTFTNYGSMVGNLNVGEGIDFVNMGSIVASSTYGGEMLMTKIQTMSKISFGNTSIVNLKLDSSKTIPIVSTSSISLGGSLLVSLLEGFDPVESSESGYPLMMAPSFEGSFDRMEVDGSQCQNPTFQVASNFLLLKCSGVVVATQVETAQIETFESIPTMEESPQSGSLAIPTFVIPLAHEQIDSTSDHSDRNVIIISVVCVVVGLMLVGIVLGLVIYRVKKGSWRKLKEENPNPQRTAEYNL